MWQELLNQSWMMHNWSIGVWMAVFAGLAFVAASAILLNGPAALPSGMMGESDHNLAPPKPDDRDEK